MILGYGIVLVAAGGAVAQISPVGGDLVGLVGSLGVLFGLILLIVAVRLYRNPDGHTGYGIAIIVLSVLSIVGGGGAILGLIIGLIGGILALIWNPSDDFEPLPGASGALSGPRFCPSCGRQDLTGATFCGSCGSPI